MYQNTKNHRIWLIALIVTAFYMMCGSSLRASVGADLARSTLDQAQAVTAKYSGAANVQQRDDAIKSLRDETSQHLSHLTPGDRADYVEYMANELAKGEGNNDSEDAFMFISAGPSLEEIADGSSRLLSSNDPSVQNTGEQLLRIDEGAKLPNGETGQNISVFNLALHDPKVPQDRLIGALFKLAPVESAQWFADHAGLPADERAGLESDLQQAWKLHHAPYGPAADNDAKAKLDHWLNSPSWILRSLANGLLQKHQEWQTPDLKKAMQPVQVPTGLQITPGQ